jgi:hypothetical protein
MRRDGAGVRRRLRGVGLRSDRAASRNDRRILPEPPDCRVDPEDQLSQELRDEQEHDALGLPPVEEHSYVPALGATRRSKRATLQFTGAHESVRE